MKTRMRERKMKKNQKKRIHRKVKKNKRRI
jgi:hypothetical protein